MSIDAINEIKELILKCSDDDYSKPLETIAIANGELSNTDKIMLLKLMAKNDNSKQVQLKKQLGKIANHDIEWPDYLDTFIFVMSHNCYYNIKTLSSVVEQSLNTACENLKIIVNGDTKFLKPSLAFKKLNGICVDNISWQPVPYGEKINPISTMGNGTTFLNRYRPPTIQPVKGSVKLFTNLVAYLVTDSKVRELLLDWMAFILRFPNIKINWQILFIGRPRIGKDAIFKPLYKIMGSSSGEASNIELEEGFTDYLQDTKFLTIQEIYHPRNKSIQAKIKGYTASTAGGLLRINPKYGRKTEIPNLLSVVAFSNHEDALQMDEDDDRFVVINSQVNRMPDEYYSKYFKWLDNEQGIEKIMNFLLNRNLDDFNYGSLPIRTEAYHALVKEGRPQWVQALEILANDSEGPFSKDYVTVKRVTNYVNGNLTNNKFSVAEKTVSNRLKEFGFKKLKQGARKIKGENKVTSRYWARGELLNTLSNKTARDIYDYFDKKSR